MADAVAEKTKIKDDEFDIHGDLAVSEADDKSFVVLYDSSKEGAPSEAAFTPAPTAEITAPSLEDIDESHAMAPASEVHPEDAYIDDILSSDDIEINETPAAAPAQTAALADEEGPIALSSEELDGILEMGPASEEEFHPDFPVDHGSAEAEPPPMPAAHDELNAAHEPELGYDDDELPIALSDEDLDEILLEEEGVPHAPAASAAPVRSSPAMAPPPAPSLDEDEEPIALSDDELDHILADAEAGHSAPPAPSAPELAPPGNEDEVLTFDEDPEITLIDDSSADFGGTSQTAAPVAEAGGFFDGDEDEPITLSDEELDGILSTAPEEDAPKQSDEMALSEMPSDGVVDVEDDEPIALSNEELDGILMDAEEAPVEDAGVMTDEATAPAHGDGGFFDSDEDEPIALSADELDGIAATATTEDAPPEAPALADLPPEGEAAIDSRYADVDQMAEAPAPAADEDDGPIALSSDELDGIVADSHEVTPEAPMMPLSPMDTGADEPSLADNQEKPATVFEEDLDAATLIHEDEKAEAAAPAPDTEELKSVMTYLDNLLGELPDDVIEKFAQSEYFKMYQKIMDKLGL